MREFKSKKRCYFLFGLAIFTVLQLGRGALAEKQLPELREELPTFDKNDTKRFWNNGPTEFDHCPLHQSSTSCSSQYSASKEQCQGKLSLHSLLKHFFPSEEIAVLTSNFIPPEKFDCLKFYINTCKGYLEFQATAREDIDMIPNRLRMSEASLILRIMYNLKSLNYAAISFELNGVVFMESRKLPITCTKSFDNQPLSIVMDANQMNIGEFAKLFSVSEFTSTDLPPAVEELKMLTLTAISIKGFYYLDGYFEIILKGKPETATIFQHSILYMLIQRPSNDGITAGLAAYFSAVSFQEILSGVIGRDIFYKIPILWYGKLNIVLQTSLNGIAKVKDEDFNKAFRFFVTRGMAIAKGLSICVEFPFQMYANAVSSTITESNLPLKFLFVGKISQKMISISFSTELVMSLKSSFLILMSQADATRLLMAFQNQQTLCRITRMDLVLATSEIRASLKVQNSVNIAQKLPEISAFEIILKKNLTDKWMISGHGTGKIANIEFEVEMKNVDSTSYLLLARTDTLSSITLFENIAKNTGLLEMFKSFDFFNFQITNILAKSRMNAGLNFRLTGVPNAFGTETSQYTEAILYNNSRNSPGLAFGMVFKSISFEELLVKLFGPMQQRGIWLQKVDCAILISSDNYMHSRRKVHFTFVELNALTLKRGFTIGFRIIFPGECGGDALCDFLKAHIGPVTSSGITLIGNLTQTGISCEWKANYITISTNLHLSNVIFKVFGGNVIQSGLFATFNLKLYNFTFEGALSADQASGLLLEMNMDGQFDNIFSVYGCSFSQLSYSNTITSMEKLEFFEINAKVHLGTVHVKRRITSDAMITLSLRDVQQSYFYSKTSSVDLKSILDSYGIHYQIPIVLHGAEISGAGIVSYSNNPRTFTVQDLNLKIENKLTAQGIMSILGGYLGKFSISITASGLLLEIRLPRLSFAGGFVKIISSCDCSNVEKFDGPTLVAKLGSVSVEVLMSGVVKCLGLSKLTNVTINDSGYAFNISGSLFGVFESDFFLTAAYGKPSDVAFKVSTCITAALSNVTNKIVQQLKYISNNTKDLLTKTKRKVAELEMILQQSHKRMDIHNDQSEAYKTKIEEEINMLKKMRIISPEPCPNECKNVCMGAPGWANNALPFGEHFVGTPKWNKCIHEIPDIVCVVQCLGRSVIRSVKAFNKQRKLQKLVNSYQHSVEKGKQAKRFLQRTVYRVGAVIDKLENANEDMTVGLKVARSLAGKRHSQSVNLDKICMEGLVEEIVRLDAQFYVKGKIGEKVIDLNVRAKIDSQLWRRLAAETLNSVYTNATLFKEAVTSVRSILQDAENHKKEILRELRDNIIKNDIGDTYKKDFVAYGEGFKKIAYEELPRYTLGNDKIMQLFEKESPWVLIQSNDPLEDAFISNGTRRMIPEKIEKETGGHKEKVEESERSPCATLNKTLHKYKEIIRVASEIAENFFEEKISYLKNKNKQLAALKDVEDQIKSECYIENCTISEMNDALKYTGRTKKGLLTWMGEMKDQILKHDRTSLQVLSENIAAIVEKEDNVKLSNYINSITDELSTLYKREVKSEALDSNLSVLEQMDLDMRDLLLNSRGRRLTHTAPLIFSMKRRFNRVYNTIITDCLERRSHNREKKKAIPES